VALQHMAMDGLPVAFRGDIGAHIARRRAELCENHFGLSGRVKVGDDDRCALGDQTAGAGKSDTPQPPGYQSDTSRQIAHYQARSLSVSHSRMGQEQAMVTCQNEQAGAAT